MNLFNQILKTPFEQINQNIKVANSLLEDLVWIDWQSILKYDSSKDKSKCLLQHKNDFENCIVSYCLKCVNMKYSMLPYFVDEIFIMI